MKIKSIIIPMVMVSLFFLTSVAIAHEWEGWRGTEGWGMGHPYQKILDPKAPIKTVSGEVISVDTVVPMKGMSQGVHLTLFTKEKETISVHLGPAWFIERLDTKIKKGDEVEVKGSMVIMTVEKKPGESTYEHTLIAQEVKKGDKVLILRDATGEPVWAGWIKMEK